MYNVLTIGAGAMGLLYASQLSTSKKVNVCFGGRGERYKKLKESIFVFNDKRYNFEIIDIENYTGKPFDLIIIAVKFFQLEESIKNLDKLIGENTVFVSLLNGLDSEDIIADMYGDKRVVYSMTVGMDSVRNPDGSVTCKNFGKLVFGAKNDNQSRNVELVKDIFDTAKVAYEIPENIMKSIWWKFMVNVGINQASAVMGLAYGAFQNSEEVRKPMINLMKEVIILSKYEGIDLDEEEDLNKKWFKVLNSLSPTAKTSMLQDVEAKRMTEVDIFAGKVIALGKKHNVSTPYNQVFFDIIKGIQSSYL
ncbi:MAG: 2-dehydropantoate 2-reductase [Deferribacteraceae bacterium]|jgi:2-dehydropantoate 2-reductase|nr:2-dehydropantoate 2-reductase [Deferribacteraceae bacterium]